MARLKLPDDVAERYELVGWKGGTRQDFGRYGTVDIEKLTPIRAQRLVARKFPHLKERKLKPAPPKDDKGKK